MHFLSTGFHGRGLVRHRHFLAGQLVGLLQAGDLKGLGSLHRPELRTVHSSGHEHTALDFLDGVRHLDRGHTGSAPFCRLDRILDQLRRHTGPGPVMNRDDLHVITEFRQPVHHRGLPGGSPGHHGTNLGTPEHLGHGPRGRQAILANHQNHTINQRALFKCQQ